LICDCPVDEISSRFCPLLDFFINDTLVDVVVDLFKSRDVL
jgi:hypothetical protein